MKFIGLLVIVAILFSGCKKSDPKPASLELKQDTIQVDTLYIEDGPRHFDVEFKNAGDLDLRIFDVSSSCDCVKTEEYPTSVIKGNNSGNIKFTINVSNYTPCEFSQTVFISTNTFDSPVPLTFKGVVRKK